MADRKIVYVSTCCNSPAKKPPCSMEKGQHVKLYLGAKPEGESSLGRWRCTVCRKPCKVTRTVKLESPKQEAAVA